MQMMNAKQFALTLISLTVVFIVFSSSIFYNSIEGPLVVACFILLVLVNKDILTYAREVKLIFFIHLLFACSVLTTGIRFYTRQQVSLTEAISDASSIVMVSILGLIVYVAFQNMIVRRFLSYLVLLFAAGLLIYCAGHGEGRVYDTQGRYVLNVGLLLCLLSLYILADNHKTSPKTLFLIIFSSSAALYVAFIAIQSRAMSIALCLSWLVALFSFRQKNTFSFVYLISPVVIIIGLQSFSTFGEANLQRYTSLLGLIQATSEREESILHDTSLRQSAGQPAGMNTSDVKPNDVSTIVPAPDVSSNMNSQSHEQIVVRDDVIKEIIMTSDNSLGNRYKMLVVGFSYFNTARLFGLGNMGEADIIKYQFNSDHPHLHNQYLSLLISGGLVHLLIGGLFLAAPFISNNQKIKYRNTLPMISFMFCFLCFESLLQLTGWRNLLIIYSYAIAGLLHVKPDLR